MMISRMLVTSLFLPLFAGANLVVDDAQISKDFAKKLGALVDDEKSLNGQQASEQLEKAGDHKVPCQDASKLRLVLEGDNLYETCAPAVVAVGSVYKCGKCSNWHLGSFATGWVLSSDGMIVTNYHVLAKESKNHIGVMTLAGDVFPVTEVLAGNKAGDAAVFRVDTGGKALPCLRLATSAAPGDVVSIISHPKRRFFSLTKGVLSRYYKRKKFGDEAVWMSVTADYATGSSGGPVMNTRGEVVGMVSSTSTAVASRATAKEKTQGNVQMVFKDCVGLDTLRRVITPEEKK